MNWNQFIQENDRHFGSPFERMFIQQVLTKVADLAPEKVSCQTDFKDSQGKTRRVDFTIEESDAVRLAIEVDGWDKKGRGSGMTLPEFVAWSRRELSLNRPPRKSR